MQNFLRGGKKRNTPQNRNQTFKRQSSHGHLVSSKQKNGSFPKSPRRFSHGNIVDAAVAAPAILSRSRASYGSRESRESQEESCGGNVITPDSLAINFCPPPGLPQREQKAPVVSAHHFSFEGSRKDSSLQSTPATTPPPPGLAPFSQSQRASPFSPRGVDIKTVSGSPASAVARSSLQPNVEDQLAVFHQKNLLWQKLVDWSVCAEQHTQAADVKRRYFWIFKIINLLIGGVAGGGTAFEGIAGAAQCDGEASLLLILWGSMQVLHMMLSSQIFGRFKESLDSHVNSAREYSGMVESVKRFLELSHAVPIDDIIEDLHLRATKIREKELPLSKDIKKKRAEIKVSRENELQSYRQVVMALHKSPSVPRAVTRCAAETV